ncbi:MAG: RDD family protein [Bacilli bacterium]|nr:RDD family protein [Bacilli bacterium]
MRVGFFRRAGAFFIDSIPIIMLLSLLLSFFVGDLLKAQFENFDQISDEYTINVEEYYATLEGYNSDLENEIITQAEYEVLFADLDEQFNTDNIDAQGVILSYYMNVFFYYLISYAIISYFYNLIMKGQTFGRKLFQIELAGKITWYTLLIRELLWKTMFWITTLFFGLVIDAFMISFTKKKKTLRDIFSGTQLIFKGTSYPF